jgi:ribonuclease HI
MPHEEEVEMSTSVPALKRGRYLLNTDGGVRNNGHKVPMEAKDAAIGVVLSDPDDREVDSYSARIGPATVQGAEYRALISGLEFARRRGVTKIRAFVDNQLVVDQINGNAAVKNEDLKKLHRKTATLLQRFPDHRVYWVPRERNRRADAMVRKALYGVLSSE